MDGTSAQFGHRSSGGAARSRIWAAGKKRQDDKTRTRRREALQLRLAHEVRNREIRLANEIEAAIAAAAAEKAYRERPTGAQIVEEVCAKHGVAVREVLSDCRERRFLPARFEACWRIRTELNWPLTKIGKLMHRDHATVMHAIRMHGQRTAEGSR